MKPKLTIIAICALCLFCITPGVAQTQTNVVSKPVQNVWYQSAGYEVWPLEHTDAHSSLFLWQPASKMKADLFVTFDNETMTASTSKVQFSDKRYCSYRAFVGSDHRTRLIYLHENTAPKVCHLHLDVLNSEVERNNLVLDADIYTFEFEIDYEIKFVQSPDKEHFAFLIYHKDYADNVSKIHAVVFDQNGNIVWENDVVPEFEEQFFRTFDYCMDNNGTIYLPVLSMNKDKDEKKITEQYLNLVRVQENGVETDRVEADFGFPSHAKVENTQNGNVLLCGFYQEDLDELSTETGVFVFLYDPKKQEFTSSFHHDFDASYFAKYPKTDKGVPHPVHPWYQILCNQIFESTNGDIVICAEHVSRKITYSVDYGSYTRRMGDILLIRYVPGKSITMQLVPKNQSGVSRGNPLDWRHVFVSYTAFMRHNDLYLVYNDAVANIPYPGKGEEIAISPWGANNKFASVCTRITNDGKILQMPLTMFSNSRMMYRDFLFADDQYLYVSMIEKDGIRFTKCPLP